MNKYGFIFSLLISIMCSLTAHADVKKYGFVCQAQAYLSTPNSEEQSNKTDLQMKYDYAGLYDLNVDGYSILIKNLSGGFEDLPSGSKFSSVIFEITKGDFISRSISTMRDSKINWEESFFMTLGANKNLEIHCQWNP